MINNITLLLLDVTYLVVLIYNFKYNKFNVNELFKLTCLFLLTIKVLNHLWKHGIKEDRDNEISNLVFVLLTEDLFDINNKLSKNE